ncbi:MAG: hypothetical protein R3A52_31750 [Polyangiales bacterium]
MSQHVELELPDDLARQVGSVARRTQRRVEDVLLDWIGRAASDLPPDELSDEQLIALCDQQLPEADQTSLSDLLARQREGVLADDDRPKLDALLAAYRAGLLRKAHAWRVAVARGLRSLSDE